jgi:predicted GIY-YIG superfamily endonuclease
LRIKLPKLHHNVYVVLLDERIASLRKVRELNPDRDAAKPCIYIGMTGLDPVERFKKHKAGYKASRYVQKYGVRLMPELYESLNPMTYDEAVIAEQGLARKLRNEGYVVLGGH